MGRPAESSGVSPLPDASGTSAAALPWRPRVVLCSGYLLCAAREFDRLDLPVPVFIWPGVRSTRIKIRLHGSAVPADFCQIWPFCETNLKSGLSPKLFSNLAPEVGSNEDGADLVHVGSILVGADPLF